MTRFFRFGIVGAFLAASLAFNAPRVFAQEHAPDSTAPTHSEEAVDSAAGEEHAAEGTHAEAAHSEGGHGGHSTGPKPVFDPEHGTLLNGVARAIVPTVNSIIGVKTDANGPHGPAVKYDFLIVTPILWAILAAIMVSAARKIKVRPEGKASSSANIIEAAISAFQDYLIAVMGNDLARKYTPLIASFFFTILVSNWLGLVPGLLAPSSVPAVPISISIVAFLAVHVIAIKETGFKSWFMHFVGEPVWLAPLNFPLHLVGELIKPLSLSLRLLCNVFGEEMVVATLTGLAIAVLPAWLPIPFQLPMLFLGTFFGFLQALVFSTLLSIYISIFATHHEDGHGHPSTEHAVDSNGHKHTVGHAAELMVG
ncbi:ATP synthase F0 subunit A [bacterium]|nr:MAG: ATP synthase F0 subunit A [bacterium]